MIDGYALGGLHQGAALHRGVDAGQGDEARCGAASRPMPPITPLSAAARKMAALREKLIYRGIDASAIDRIKAPAGLDLGAITPEEIAMSILAEITSLRRRGQRIPPP